MKKRILSMLLVIVLVLSMVPVSALAAEGLKITSTKSSKYVVIDVDTITLTATNGDGTAPTGTLTWEFAPADAVEQTASADSTKCTFTGKTQGEVTVTVKGEDGKIGTKNLTVIQPPVDLKLVKKGTDVAADSTLTVGNTVELDYTCSNAGDNAIIPEYTTSNWKVQNSNPEGVLTVTDAGVVTAVKAGTAKVRFALNGKSVVQQFTVVDPPAAPVQKKLSIVADMTTMYPNRTLSLKAVDADGNAVEGVAWSSSDETVATVAAGVVTSKKVGEVVITAAKDDYTSATEKITVEANAFRIVNEAGNTVNAINVNETVKLQVWDKSNTAQSGFQWTSSDANCATVDNSTGELRGVTPGSVTVTATKGGCTVTCEVTVEKVPLTIKADDDVKKFYVGKTYQLNVYDDEGNAVGVTWGSEDPKSVEIDQDGKMTVLVAGVGKTIEITAEPTNINTYASATFSVKVLANSLKITDANGKKVTKLNVNETVELVAKDGNGDIVDGVKWACSDKQTAYFVSGSSLKGIRQSDTPVTITVSKDGYTEGTQEILVSVKSFDIKNEKGEIVTDVEMLAGTTMQLKAVGPDGELPVVWTSASNKVSVDSTGLVTAKKSTLREAVSIDAKLPGYETKTVKVTVTQAPKFTAVKLAGDEERSNMLAVSETRKLIALDADGLEVEGVEWKVANGRAVLEDGALTGVEAGEVAVTATKDGYASMNLVVNVYVQPVTGFEIGELPAVDEDGYIPMEIGDKLPLNITNVQPDYASDWTAITWTSNAPEVAKVDTETGELIALKHGYATLTATASNAASAAMQRSTGILMQLKVHVLAEERIRLDDAMPGEVLAGKALDLKASVVYADGEPVPKTSVKWTILSEEEGVRLFNGKLETRSDMEYQHDIWLRAEAVGSEAEPIEVMVKVVPVTTNITLKVGEKKVNNQTYVVDLNDDYIAENGIVVSASILPLSATQKVRWEITDPSNVCTEEQWDTDIKLTPVSILKSGVVTVTAYAGDGTGEMATAKIQFSRLGEGKLKDVPTILRGGASLDLSKYLVRDENVDDKKVTWSIAGNVLNNGKKIASIGKNGKLTTKPVTEAQDIEVTVKGSSGVSDTKTITLLPATKSITISGVPKTVEFGKRNENGELREYPLSVKVNPEIPVDDDGNPVWDLVWSSTNENVAKVVGDNVLIIKGPGKVRIDCTTTDGSKVKGSVNLEVISTVNTVTVSPDGRALKYGDSLDMKAVIKTPTNRNAADQRVIWSIADEYGDATDAAIISATGRVTAKDVEQNTKVVVTATSVANNEIYGTATVTIKPNTNKTLHAFIDDEMVNGTISMNLGDSCVLDPMWQKSGSGDMKDAEDCQFFSSNTGVATVDRELGTLDAVGYGSSRITLRCVDPQTNNEYTASFTVKVMKKVGTVTISAPTVKDLRSGKSVSLSATAWTDYANNVKADNQSFTWEVYDVDEAGDVILDRASKAASIGSNGVLYGSTVYSKHVVEVWAVSKENGVVGKVQFNIFPADSVAMAFELDGEEYATALPIDIDDYNDVLPLKVMVHEAIADSKGNITEQPTFEASVNWSSDNKNVVEVRDNVLHVKAIGRAKLTAKYYRTADRRTYQASITVVVNQTIGSIEEIQMSNILVAGKSADLRVVVENPNATNKNVLWSVTGPNADMVQLNTYTGRIKAKSNIYEQITVCVVATPVDGSDSFETDITIYPRTTKVWILDEDGEKINGKTIPVALDDVVTFEATADPDGAYDDAFQWTSSNKSVVEVDEDGNLILKKAGAVTIKVTALDGSGKYAKFKLRITNN